uniref:RNA-directed RNA polymerase n=1 Tax=Conidiobolus adiaeretus totivirus 1 TaxID=2980973 RepID=A0A977R5H1_9VIRU|nr:RNA-dependent RNA polymerase [Conidiobolus adiaeretus totivirus 1]
MRERTGFVTMDIQETERRGREWSFTMRDGYVPTALRITKEGNVIATTFEDSEYVLIDRMEGYASKQEVSYDYYGTVVSALLMPGKDAVYVYYKNDQDILPVTVNILAILSRHFLGDFSGYYNDWCATDNVFFGIGKAGGKEFRHTAESLKSLEKPKISGDHHIHYTAHEVWTALDRVEKEKARQAFRLPEDATTSFMGGVMLWLASLDDRLYNEVVSSNLLDVDSTIEFAKEAKKVSIRAKSFQNIVEDDLRTIFEADVLVNRDVGSVDWEAEKKNRVTPNLTDFTYNQIYRDALQLFTKTDGMKEKPRSLSWDKFWAARWQWSAAGSIHSQYPKDLMHLPKDRELKNKFIALTLAENTDINKYLSRQPELQAWSSVKYEWGKMRAIYGTDLTSYILAHFAFYNCEDTLPSDFPVGTKARPSFVSARVSSVLKNSIPLCIDFEDFNSQHSNEAMTAVIDAYIEAHKMHLTKEQILAAEWTKDSIMNTRVNDNMGTKTTYNSKGTLMSGWRLTTYMNSVLNYIYTKRIVKGNVSKMQSVHNGDDVLIGARNIRLITTALKNAKRHNVRLQRTKCAFGGLAEFLRVDHMRGDHGQYLTRNIATTMHSRIESKIAVSAVDIVQAMEDRLKEFIQRGGKIALAGRLREIYYERMAPVYSLVPEDLYVIRTSHRVVGGISEERTSDISNIITIESTKVETELPDHLPGVIDYAAALRTTLQLEVPLEKVIKRVKNATLNAVQMVRKTIKIVKNTNELRYMTLRALHKSYSDVASTPLFGKGMLTGFIFDVMSTSKQLGAMARIISGSHDPIEFLRVIA